MGDFPDAVTASSEVLKIAGRIYPATAENVALEAVLADGSKVVGETRISRSRSRIKRVQLIPRTVRPLAAALTAIREADVITLGPGSLFTSVVPNLLVKGIAQAIRKSPAVKVYFVNLMWQPGETTDFRASDHVRAVHRPRRRQDSGLRRRSTCGSIPRLIMKRYAREAGARRWRTISKRFSRLGVKVILGKPGQPYRQVRHDPAATAAMVVKLATKADAANSAGSNAGHNRRRCDSSYCSDPGRRARDADEVAEGESAAPRRGESAGPARGGYGARAHRPRSAIFVVVGHQAEEVRRAVTTPGVRLHRTDRAEGHGPRRDGGARGAGRAGRLPDDPLRRFAAAARGDARSG